MKTIKERILQAIEQEPYITITAISHRTRISYPTVLKYLEKKEIKQQLTVTKVGNAKVIRLKKGKGGAGQTMKTGAKNETKKAICKKCGRPFSEQEKRAGYDTCEHCDFQNRKKKQEKG